VRIAYVTETYPPEVNGVALTVDRTVRFLRQCGHQLELIRPRQRGEAPLDSAEEWRSSGMPIPMYPDLRFGVALPATLRRRFLRRRPHLVHIATQGPLGRAALLAATSLHVPVTTDFRTNFHGYSHYYRLGWLESLVRRYLRDFHNRANRTFVPSQALRAELSHQGFERLEVIGRGVDTTLFSPARRSAALRASWGVQDDDPVMLYVGRLAAEKNVELALRAFAAARLLRPRMRMIVVGDGPLRSRLQSRYPAARFVGVQRGEALAELYASADVFVFPSCTETFGNVTLEALASGLAVVAFDCAAAGEYIRTQHDGLLVPVGDELGFIQATCRTTESVALLTPLRARARDTALSAQWDAVLKRFDSQLVQVAMTVPLARQHDVALA
jgi:glycosyltransferase involved in cell wall biosynthesis